MGRLTVVKRQVVRGATGAPGVNAVPADEFIADRVATPGSETRTALDDDFAAKSTQLTVEAGRLSAADLEATFADQATQNTVETGRLSEDTLGQTFAARSTQDTVEAGRLHDDVLTNRFQIPSIYIGANQMVAATGSPSNSPSNSHVPVWRLDSATDESVAFSVKVPKAWATYDVKAIGHNGGAGSGVVRLKCLYGSYADGDDVTVNTDVNAVTFTVSAQNIRQTVKIHAIDPSDHTRTQVFRVLRDADDASDTLGNDWFLSGVELVATEFTIFEPELTEDPDDLDGQAFVQAHNAFLDGLQVWWSSIPPDSDAEDLDFKYYPGTDYASMNSDYVDSTWDLGDKWYTLWGSRFNYGTAFNTKPNILPSPQINSGSRECRSVFTTRQKAEAALKSQIRHLCGLSSGTVQAPWIAAGGIAGDLIAEQDLRDNPETYFTTAWTHDSTTYMVMVDKVLLPTALLGDGPNPSNTKGIRLDYEVQDDRTEAQTTALITDVAGVLHTAGYELSLFTNALNAPSLPKSGIGANLPTLFGLADKMVVWIWGSNAEGSVAASYDNQIATLGTLTTPDWAKIWLFFEIAPDGGFGGNGQGTTIADAEFAYDKLHEPGTDHPTGVEFWRRTAAMGGSQDRLVNRKVSMVCFGTETPPS